MKFSRALLLALSLAVGTAAAQPTDIDARALRLAEQLRCVVCQNQSLADSHAELAQDLKRELRARLDAGASDAAVLDFMVRRYGDFVLYKPPLDERTALLWWGPLLLLGIGVWLLRGAVGRRRAR